MPSKKQSKPSLMDLPTEVRINIYNMAIDLDPKQYDFEKDHWYTDDGATTSLLLKAQIEILESLGRTCRKIREEVLSEFFWQNQIYLRHECYSAKRGSFYYSNHFQIGLDMILRSPLFAKYTTNVYWAMMLYDDMESLDTREYRGIREYEPDFFEVDKNTPWPWDMYYFVMGLPNLTMLHIDVEVIEDWYDLKEWSSWSGFMFELWNRPTMKKLTLRLTFKGADKVVKKAFKSRFVRRGRPENCLKTNILNHLLTLPEICLILPIIVVPLLSSSSLYHVSDTTCSINRLLTSFLPRQDFYKDIPSRVIQRHFGYMNPKWPRLERF